ncbi:hypothetical protein BH24ACI3_BH24ACI3_04280 [soil metagenome]
MPAKKVLVVEDEELMRSILRRLLEGEGYRLLAKFFVSKSASAHTVRLAR